MNNTSYKFEKGQYVRMRIEGCSDFIYVGKIIDDIPCRKTLKVFNLATKRMNYKFPENLKVMNNDELILWKIENL